MAKQPTATAFTRTQESWALHVLDKVRGDIDGRENFLRNKGVPESQWGDDYIIQELDEDALFWERYADEMVRQRDYIREHFLD